MRDRDLRKNYKSVEEVYADIVDLAGVRVALYFPAQIGQVEGIIDDVFRVERKKEFPDGSPSKYQKRFSGYSAIHYRIRLKEASLVDSQKRYAEARVEVQVASVLMHAWSEVEHDLVYKPYQGSLSADEYAILDELNGMVISGEIALERLQRAGDMRVAVSGRTFGNHYEVAAHLLTILSGFKEADALQAGLGRVDLLYLLLSRLGQATPDAIGRYVEALHPDLERRPIASQIIDQVLAEDTERYKIYEELRGTHPSSEVAAADSEPTEEELHAAIGEFLAAWIDLEKSIRLLTPPEMRKRGLVVATSRVIREIVEVDTMTQIQFDRLRRMRNDVVHGLEFPDPSELREAARQLIAIRQQLPTPKPDPDAPF